MKMNAWWKRFPVAVAALLLASQGGCDSVVDPGDHPSGIVLVRSDGSEAARFIYPETVTGGLTVPVGGSATYRVLVVTESGALVDIDGEEYSIGDASVLIPLRVDVAVQGDDQIVLTGLAAGPTTLFFDLEHGLHTEFEVKNIPVSVQSAV